MQWRALAHCKHSCFWARMTNHGGDISRGKNPRMASRFQSCRYLDEPVVSLKPSLSGPTLGCRLGTPDALIRRNFSTTRENHFTLQDGLHAVLLDNFDAPIVKYVQKSFTNRTRMRGHELPASDQLETGAVS